LTAREIAERVLSVENITEPERAALVDLIGTINSSLRNHDGKGVQRTNEGEPGEMGAQKIVKHRQFKGFSENFNNPLGN
jgi:hypothetical protein